MAVAPCGRRENLPEAYAVIQRSTRRVLLPRFPYGLYYRVLEQNVVVVACIHGKRHPRRGALDEES